MKKTAFIPCILMLILASCHQKQEQKSIETPEPQEAVVLDGVYHFKLDGFDLWTLQDVQRKMSADLFKDAKKADIEQYMPDGEADAAINTFLVKINGKYILFDTGLGLDKGGVMLDKLTLLNLRPEDISTVCITHCHGDHIGGLVSNGEPVFPNAEVYCADKELKAFKNDALTKEMIKVYDSRLHPFTAGDTLLGAIRSIDASGHTPGHTLYQIGNVLIIGDLIHAAALQIPHPEYCAKYDADKKLAAKTRKEIYQYIRDNQLVVAGMHLPFSGVMEHFEEQ
jgi:glyoxylase-like metal-dependent hydrolase (beta-lactamase superfamily II)